MWTVLFLVMFFGLLSAGMPIFLVLGACAAVLYFVSGQPMIGVAQVIIDHLNSSTLMSLPLFVMAAAFMRQGGVAKALVDLCTAWIGGVRGSLGLVTVVACTLFAAICGSSVATALAMGTILLPAMIEKGYPRSFALGVIGAGRPRRPARPRPAPPPPRPLPRSAAAPPASPPLLSPPRLLRGLPPAPRSCRWAAAPRPPTPSPAEPPQAHAPPADLHPFL